MKISKEHVHTHGKKSPRHLAPPGASQDRRRSEEELRHHAEEAHHRPPEHHPQHKPVLPRHNTHKQPPEYAIDIDHGTHTDRPVPGKVPKKINRPGLAGRGRYP